jgi:hypothetical protein
MKREEAVTLRPDAVSLRPGADPCSTYKLRLESAHSGDSRLPLWRPEKEGEANEGC